MANVCSDYNVKGCSASFYLECPAYLADRNCWEVAKRPCCAQPDRTACRSCQVYLVGVECLAPEAPRSRL